ncbi:ATP11 protein-domain-containing protein [Rhodocollybia butyracea]|uniref:ATP11 protein-domain-containing protein n=1 Tax=Rhodocollybia butyracea TaxID=206335 RepID=A0A9P5PZG0_9AGAR|nr:ATP11 protein-domain-containing protein [Rhodocollybia butyracea]
MHHIRRACRATLPRTVLTRRALHVNTNNLESKYAEKLRQRAEEQGVSVSQLVENVKEAERKRLRELNAEAVRAKQAAEAKINASPKSTGPEINKGPEIPRKDSSPIKPLGSILNLPRVVSVNADAVSALWTAYHASRSEGTGRGYLCASIPLEAYEKMTAVAAKYSSFVLPVPRPNPAADPGTPEAAETPYEFHFMQWGFHEVPPIPSAADPDPFVPSTHTPSVSDGSTNPPTSTILFTPLQEYKMRNSYATPYLVLTHYTDLARTHGIVLLRGEITPGPGNDGRYLLSQEDAQILTLGVQKFYLWSDSKDPARDNESTGESFLKTFHENPQNFDWQEMLKYSTQL